MNKWIFAGIGEFIGVILYTTSGEFYGVSTAADLAQMLGFGIPFALIGFVIGMIVDKFNKKPKED